MYVAFNNLPGHLGKIQAQCECVDYRQGTQQLIFDADSEVKGQIQMCAMFINSPAHPH